MSSGRTFQLRERLGAGAFGAVYRAEMTSAGGFSRPVALKVLHAKHAGFSEVARRMRDEARILGRLNHRNVVGVLDLIQLSDGQWAVVMDVVEGGDLEQLVRALRQTGEQLPTRAIFEIGAGIAAALDIAFHADDGKGGQLSVVHRDIKPSNVRLTADGEVKVLDFGIASVQLEGREAETGRFRMGTELYMSPERIAAKGDTPAGDVYAVGLILAELALRTPLGRCPIFPDEHRPWLDQALAGLDDSLATWVGRCCAYDPESRPSAGELSQALADLAEQRIDQESLRRFCSRFVPQLGMLLGTDVHVITKVLTEQTLGVTGPTAVPLTESVDGDSATWIDGPQVVGHASEPLATQAEEPVLAEPAATPPSVRRPSWRLALLAAPALLALTDATWAVDAWLNHRILRMVQGEIEVQDTVVVALDQIGDLRSYRKEYPRAIRGLAAAGATAVIIDLRLTAPTTDDLAIAEAMEAVDIPVYLRIRVDDESGLEPPGTERLARAARLGLVEFASDLLTGTLRAAVTRRRDQEGHSHWHLTALAAAGHLGARGEPRIEDDELIIGPLRNPVDRFELAHLPPVGAVPRVPFSEESRWGEAAGKVAIIGLYGGYDDYHRTLDGPRYGSEVLASTVQVFLRQAAARRGALELDALAALFTGVGAFAATRRQGWPWGLLVVGAVSAVWMSLAFSAILGAWTPVWLAGALGLWVARRTA